MDGFDRLCHALDRQCLRASACHTSRMANNSSHEPTHCRLPRAKALLGESPGDYGEHRSALWMHLGSRESDDARLVLELLSACGIREDVGWRALVEDAVHPDSGLAPLCALVELLENVVDEDRSWVPLQVLLCGRAETSRRQAAFAVHEPRVAAVVLHVSRDGGAESGLSLVADWCWCRGGGDCDDGRARDACVATSRSVGTKPVLPGDRRQRPSSVLEPVAWHCVVRLRPQRFICFKEEGVVCSSGNRHGSLVQFERSLRQWRY